MHVQRPVDHGNATNRGIWFHIVSLSRRGFSRCADALDEDGLVDVLLSNGSQPRSDRDPGLGYGQRRPPEFFR